MQGGWPTTPYCLYGHVHFVSAVANHRMAETAQTDGKVSQMWRKGFRASHRWATTWPILVWYDNIIQYVDTKHKILMKLIYYMTKTENMLNPKNWDLTGKNKGKVMFLPKTWNHPTVVAVILGLAVCQKHVLNTVFLQKRYFVEVICSLHFCFRHKRGPYQSSRLQNPAVVHGIPVRIQWD